MNKDPFKVLKGYDILRNEAQLLLTTLLGSILVYKNKDSPLVAIIHKRFYMKTCSTNKILLRNKKHIYKNIA